MKNFFEINLNQGYANNLNKFLFDISYFICSSLSTTVNGIKTYFNYTDI